MEIIIRTDQPATVTTPGGTSPDGAADPLGRAAEPPAGVAQKAAMLGAQDAGPAPAAPGERSAPAPQIAAELVEPAGDPGQSAGEAPAPA